MQNDVREEMFKTLKKGVFTPFLGAGASSLRPTKLDFDSYPWKQVAQTLAAVRCRLNSEQSWKYLRSFAGQRLRMSAKRHLDRFLPMGERPNLVEELKGNQLVAVQAELVRAIVRLTNYVGMYLADETPSVHSLESSRVPFSSSKWEGEAAVHALIRAADIILKAREEKTKACESPFRLDDRRELGVGRVYEKLLKVIKVLTAGEKEVFEEELESHKELEETDVEWSGQIRLDVLLWLSDLLWYSLRYWVPCYPTTAELAFELSLHVINAPVRRAELAQAAQALETKNLADLSPRIKKLMDYCEDWQDQEKEVSLGTRYFYDAVAAALQHQFERYSAPIPDGAHKWGALESFIDPPPLPMVFTTNFDRAMERALERSGMSFHVLFPVIQAEIKERNGDERKSGVNLPIKWKLRSWFSEKRAREIGKLFKDDYWDDVCVNGTDPRVEWNGPLVVKLHGSPSELPGEFEDRHWVVLSEVGYLQALEGSSMPQWVVEQLQDSAGVEGMRSLWFLGYSISDWNVRLRLYKDSQLGGSHENRQMFNRDADPYRMAILKILRITPFLGDLNELPRLIERALKDDEIDTSPFVDELVVNLTKN